MFLRKIYYQLGINKICDNIKDKYKFDFGLNKIVECLVFSLIIWPSSKLSTFQQSKKFIGNYDFDIQHIYSALSYLSKELDTIQKQLFDYNNKVINRIYKVIYYDCTNYFFYTEQKKIIFNWYKSPTSTTTFSTNRLIYGCRRLPIRYEHKSW